MEIICIFTLSPTFNTSNGCLINWFSFFFILVICIKTFCFNPINAKAPKSVTFWIWPLIIWPWVISSIVKTLSYTKNPGLSSLISFSGAINDSIISWMLYLSEFNSFASCSLSTDNNFSLSILFKSIFSLLTIVSANL